MFSCQERVFAHAYFDYDKDDPQPKKKVYLYSNKKYLEIEELSGGGDGT